jgi:predicted Zn-dependent peptidase
MCFKGTQKRPRALDIATLMDGIGAEYNAFTGQEYTGFFAKVDSGHQDLAMDVISDIYLNSKFDPQEIEKEKGVIAEEINLYRDMPARYVSELFQKLLYGDQPAGWPIAGEKENILRFKRENFLKYLAGHYSSKNTLVVATGAIQPKKILEKIKKFFAPIGAGAPLPKTKTEEKQNKPRTLVYFKKTDQTHLSLGWRAFNLFDERRYALEILEVILGGGMSSRLFDILRGQMGAAYYVSAGSNLMTDCGYITVRASVDNQRVPEIIKVILKEYRRFQKEPVPPKELKKAKEHIKGSAILNLETSDEWATFLGGQEILEKKILTPEEIFRKIDRVTAGDIQRLAREFFRPKKLNLALIGPFKEEKKFLKILG